MKVKISFLGIIIFFGALGNAQTTETEKLLEQAEEMVHFNPTEANRISEHIVKISKNEQDIARSLYVQAVSFYVMGKYSQALEKCFFTKNHAKARGFADIENKSTELIGRTLRLLHLSVPDNLKIKNSKFTEPAFMAEDLLRKANAKLNENQTDSVFYFTKKAQDLFQPKEQGWTTALFLKLKGEYFFKEKQLDSAVFHYEGALKVAKKINNPSILREVSQKLANSYLAMEKVAKFQENTQLAQKLSTEVSKQEDEASNSAHTLIIEDLDQGHEDLKKLYERGFYGALSLLVLGLVIKLVFYFRNRNKLKMYQNLLDYFNRQNLQEEVVAEEIKEEKQEVHKTPVLLKESENQILKGLEKFEASKKFTHKDMSLGMLAAQLNTNTKYLSDVINRQKHKNFNSYINELRINYITEKIKTDPNYLNFKVSYLAEECGFSSHSTFTTVFKSIVGVSPIMFVEFVRDEVNREKLELA